MTRLILFGGLVLLAAVAVGGCAPSAQESPSNGFSGHIVAGVRQVKITARGNALEPNRILVRRGEEALILVASTDVAGTFSIPNLGVQARVEPGKTTRIELTPGMAREYPFRCTVGAEPGRGELTGTLVVVP